MDRPVPTEAVEPYKALVDTFSRLVTDYYDVYTRTRYVQSFEGQVICLQFPNDWYLFGGAGKSSWNTLLYRANEILCCDEKLIPVGICGRTDTPDDINSIRGYGTLLMLSGNHGRVYVYSSCDDTLYLLAKSLEELTRFGLSRNPFIYKSDSDSELIPADMTRVIDAATTKLPQGYAGKNLIVLFDQSDEGVTKSVGCTYFIKENFIAINTPGYGRSALYLVKNPEDLWSFWPFKWMDDVDFKRCWYAVSDQLLSTWALLGAIGYTPTGNADSDFRVEHVIVVDRFGAVYSLLLHTRTGLVRRLADNVADFFRMGMLKRIFTGSEYRITTVRRERLESRGQCPHWPEQKYAKIKRQYGRYRPVNVMSQHHMWLSQDTDTVHTVYPWDRTDPNISEQLLKTHASTVNPMKEYDARMRAAISALKLSKNDDKEDHPDVPYVYRLSFVSWKYAKTYNKMPNTRDEILSMRWANSYVDGLVPFYHARPVSEN
nr:protein m141 [Mastomys natalensis cytomegalovirus 3]WEG69957.1 protein m141 [Mastomys natalensis cytomegalovirus 3]WEG70097.1 protein m141 [Mastomys natalensis cytomegalovirus 3]WEG70237.1 protein m141 [Mastomys natalensis cytomegalovirus 3]WEG70377.1 protein m141 [Mastomys natalensis cytomegalovirus 3]